MSTPAPLPYRSYAAPSPVRLPDVMDPPTLYTFTPHSMRQYSPITARLGHPQPSPVEDRRPLYSAHLSSGLPYPQLSARYSTSEIGATPALMTCSAPTLVQFREMVREEVQQMAGRFVTDLQSTVCNQLEQSMMARWSEMKEWISQQRAMPAPAPAAPVASSPPAVEEHAQEATNSTSPAPSTQRMKRNRIPSARARDAGNSEQNEENTNTHRRSNRSRRAISEYTPTIEELASWVQYYQRRIINKTVEEVVQLVQDNSPSWKVIPDPEEHVDLRNSMLGQALDRTELALDFSRKGVRKVVERSPILERADMDAWFVEYKKRWVKPGFYARNIIQCIQYDLRKYISPCTSFSEEHPLFLSVLREHGFDVERQDEWSDWIICTPGSRVRPVVSATAIPAAAAGSAAPGSWNARLPDALLEIDEKGRVDPHRQVQAIRQMHVRVLQIRDEFLKTDTAMIAALKRAGASFVIPSIYQQFVKLYKNSTPISLDRFRPLVHALDAIEAQIAQGTFGASIVHAAERAPATNPSIQEEKEDEQEEHVQDSEEDIVDNSVDDEHQQTSHTHATSKRTSKLRLATVSEIVRFLSELPPGQTKLTELEDQLREEHGLLLRVARQTPLMSFNSVLRKAMSLVEHRGVRVVHAGSDNRYLHILVPEISTGTQ